MYNHTELVDHTCESAPGNIPASHAVTLNLHYLMPMSDVRVDVNCDEDVLKMFELYEGIFQIPVFVEVIDTSPPLISYETPGGVNRAREMGSSSRSPRVFQIDCEFTNEDEWRIHASPLPEGITYKIKSLCGDHRCVRTVRNAEATSTWIAIKFLKALRANLSMTLEAIYDDLVEVYGVAASKMQIYIGKKQALEILEGNHAKSYGKLAQYAVEIRKANPGSWVKLELERISPNLNLPTFKSLLDEVALGGNNGLYPLDYGVVESEGKDSWAYGGIIHPVQDVSLWDEVSGDPIQHPPLKRKKVRSRKSRKRMMSLILELVALEGPALFKQIGEVKFLWVASQQPRGKEGANLKLGQSGDEAIITTERGGVQDVHSS
ncbi:hypothetical protein Acr_11g0017460 [Actinidia rufa]|uniref:Uncharacterized protein n=1 Tax=Actinidia rufa TaxID=165716 RepID=A0A7J0FFF8_9ERIC|nr:hypothetical protein Acr_11g0017460 [Actinidia rufa]